jgi:hypothetical protein
MDPANLIPPMQTPSTEEGERLLGVITRCFERLAGERAYAAEQAKRRAAGTELPSSPVARFPKREAAGDDEWEELPPSEQRSGEKGEAEESLPEEGSMEEQSRKAMDAWNAELEAGTANKKEETHLVDEFRYWYDTTLCTVCEHTCG